MILTLLARNKNPRCKQTGIFIFLLIACAGNPRGRRLKGSERPLPLRIPRRNVPRGEPRRNLHIIEDRVAAVNAFWAYILDVGALRSTGSGSADGGGVVFPCSLLINASSF